jgi:hypothetical protein
MTVLPFVKLGHEYSVIEVDGSTETLKNVRQWCEETFGEEGDNWFYFRKKFYFKRSRDAIWFELRW